MEKDLFSAIKRMVSEKDVKGLSMLALSETDRAAVDAAITALARVGNDEAVDELISFLSVEDAYLRNEAIEALQLLGARAFDRVAALLKWEKPDLRIFALNALKEMKDLRLRGLIRHVLEVETDPNVASLAVECLSEVGSGEDVVLLEAVARRFPDPYVRFAVDAARRRLE
ncbi:HEAT repeat domain-containing protein [Desulfofundulus sp. TPOSR]|uniref:HEAT repeat domain-containing protein n=1 Tax=Desulfofundulus sp. TPOSR TaxID=2714340 RepID=UPI00140AA04F|nr:HEAT repeat domain-containing protein [Desulfofundulus sp. TPOSR]NHM28122.1 HEAT repeat domain-containing protein [Desulfofundulus sp. TPOSR]